MGGGGRRAASGGSKGGRCILLEVIYSGAGPRDPRDEEGHRLDSLPTCRAKAEIGWACESVFYTDADAERVQGLAGGC